MVGKSKIPALVLTPEERKRLEALSASRAAPVREVERARVLLEYHHDQNPSAIQRALRLSRVTHLPLPAHSARTASPRETLSVFRVIRG